MSQRDYTSALGVEDGILPPMRDGATECDSYSSRPPGFRDAVTNLGPPERARIVRLGDLPEAPAVEWVLPGFIPRGAITLLSAPPKMGKSTLIANLLRDLSLGGPLVERPTDAPALVLSEEPVALWQHRRTTSGVPDSVRLVERPSFANADHDEWLDTLGVMRDFIEAEGAALAVIDTIGGTWPCADENDAAQSLRALTPIRSLSEAGAGVLLVHHTRKSGGRHGLAHRGSSAIAGFPDVFGDLAPYSADSDGDTRRVLNVRGRFAGLWDSRVLDYTDGAYHVAGDRIEAKDAQYQAMIAERLPTGGLGVTCDELHSAWEASPKPGKNRLRGILNFGAEHGRWERLGTGVRDSAHRFRLPEAGDAPPPATLPLPERHKI